MDFKILEDRDEYMALMPEVDALFEQAFAKPLDRAVHDRLYWSNPFGNAVVIAGFDAGRLVSHQALIPGRLEGPAGAKIEYHTGASLMIEKTCRSAQLYIDSMDEFVRASRERGRSFIYGFPNGLTHRHLRLLARWHSDYESPLLVWTADWQSSGANPIEIGAVSRTEAWGHPWSAEYRDWRLAGGIREVARFGDLELAFRRHPEIAAATVFECFHPDPATASHDLKAFADHVGAREVRLTADYARRLGLDVSHMASHAGYVFCRFLKNLDGEAPSDVAPSLLLSDAF